MFHYIIAHRDQGNDAASAPRGRTHAALTLAMRHPILLAAFATSPRYGDNRSLIRERSDNASRTLIIGSLFRQQQGLNRLESSHCSNAARLPSALPMKTHWSMSARLSANRGSVWLSEFVFGFGFEDLYVCSRRGQDGLR